MHKLPWMARVISLQVEAPCTAIVAELAAISCALEDIASRQTDRYTICTDSLSAIEAIAAQSIEDSHYFDWKIKICLRSLSLSLSGRGFKITIAWILAQSAISGNEHADRLAKAGSNSIEILSRPIYPQEVHMVPRH